MAEVRINEEEGQNLKCTKYALFNPILIIRPYNSLPVIPYSIYQLIDERVLTCANSYFVAHFALHLIPLRSDRFTYVDFYDEETDRS
jgi:hypothetical protein